MASLPNQTCQLEMWNIVWFLLISAMPSWWKEIGSGSADSPLGSQLKWASLSCDLGCLWLSVTPKNTEGAGGVHEYVKALPSQKTEKGDADITEKFRKYSRRAGNTTVGWHRAYMNVNPKHLCCQIWYNSLGKPKACRSAALPLYKLSQTVVLPVYVSYNNF